MLRINSTIKFSIQELNVSISQNCSVYLLYGIFCFSDSKVMAEEWDNFFFFCIEFGISNLIPREFLEKFLKKIVLMAFLWYL